MGEAAEPQERLTGSLSRPKAATGPTAKQNAAWEKDYLPGVEVFHKKFGRDLLRDRTGSIATIAFREVGVKRLDLAACLKRGQIELVHFLP